MFKLRLLVPLMITLLAFLVVVVVSMFLPKTFSANVYIFGTYFWLAISLAQLQRVFPKTFWHATIPGGMVLGLCILLYYKAEPFGVVGSPLVALTAAVIACRWQWPTIKAKLRQDYPETFGCQNRQTYARIPH